MESGAMPLSRQSPGLHLGYGTQSSRQTLQWHRATRACIEHHHLHHRTIGGVVP